MVIPFLLFSGRGRWKQIFSPGHLLMLIIAIAPAVLWAIAMMERANIPFESVISIWGEQTGAKANRSIFTADHYVWFPLRAVSMMLPWVAFALMAIVPALRRRFMEALTAATADAKNSANAHTRERDLRDLWRFLVPALPVMIAIFWIWPRGEPRYLAMAAFPVAVLAAMMISAISAGIKHAEFHKHLTNFGRGTPIGVMVCAAGAVAASIYVSPQSLAGVIVVAAICFAVAIFALWIFRTSEPVKSAALVALGVAMVALCARGLVAGALFPKIAQRDSTWLLHQQVDRIVPKDLPLYTTRLFGNRKADNYYNIQFYLRTRTATGRRDPLPLEDFADLPAGKTVIVIVGKSDWEELVRAAPGAVKLGELFTERGPPALFVARVPN
jgi:hypothetical protein